MKNNPQNPGTKPIETMKAGGRIALSLKRSITWENCDDLRKKLENKIQAGHTEIILDFNKVNHIDSTGLELMIEMHDTLMKQGGALKIVSINEVCRDILLATRIINILYLYKDINEAISHNKT